MASINLSVGPAHRVAQDIQVPSSPRLLVTSAAPGSDASGEEKMSWHGFLGRLFTTGRNQRASTTALSVAVSQRRVSPSLGSGGILPQEGRKGRQ